MKPKTNRGGGFPSRLLKLKNNLLKTKLSQAIFQRGVTVFCCVSIIVFGITLLSKADSITTSIGQDISTNNLSLSGNVTSGTWAGNSIDVAHGGTGQDWSVATQGSLPYFSGTGAFSTLTPGTAGQFLQSGGVGANPSWVDSPDAATNVTRSATFVLAASDSPTLSKQQADYVCDGVDDQVEIQTAIDALPASGGKVLLLDGTYIFTNRVNIGKNYTVLAGSGWGTIIKFKNGITANFSLIESYNPSASYFIVKDLQLDGNNANTADSGNHVQGGGFHSSNATDFIIENIYAHDMWYRGISGYGMKRAKIISNFIKNVNKEAINVDYVSERNQIMNNTISGAGAGYGGTIEVDGTFGTNGYNIISGNFFENVYNSIRLVNRNVTNNIISNNIISSAAFGIQDNGESNSIVGNSIILTNNSSMIVGRFSEAIGNRITLAKNGQFIINSDFAVVKDNMFLGGMNSGVEISGNYCIFEGNEIIDVYNKEPLKVSGKYNQIRGSLFGILAGASTLALAASNGDASITVVDGSVFTPGSRIRIYSNDGTQVYVHILRNRGNVLDLETPYNGAGASVGNNVWNYLVQKNVVLEAASQGNIFENNVFRGIVSLSDLGTGNIIKNNKGGYATENSGTSTVTAGQTSATVTHGLATTPTRVQLTPTTDTAGKRYWISAKTATTFTITIDSTHTSDITFDWRGVVGEGN